MKTVLFVLFVLFVTAVVQPGANVTFAQNCVCAECGYPCKSPMVHDSKCKYKNNRQTEERTQEKSEIVSDTKSFVVADEQSDVEYQMLLLHSIIKRISGDTNMDSKEKEKQLLEISEMIGKLTPQTEEQKLMYDDIKKELQSVMK